MGRKKKRHTTQSSKKSQTRKAHLEHKDRQEKKWLKPEILLIGVFILALFIRLVYLNQIISTPIFQGLAADAEKYESFALQILKGNLTHKDFLYLNPLYPFFLALIYLIFGHGNLSIVFIQGAIDSISCIIIYYIAATLFNKKVGIISAFIYACYGIAIFYTGILLAPTVAIFFTLLFIALLLAAEEKRKAIIFFISGIFFGLTSLGRPNVTLFLLLLPLWFFTVLKNKLGINKSIRGFLLLLIGFSMITSLISIRNYSIIKKFTPSVVGGINFYTGNNPEAKGYFMSPHGISYSPVEQVKESIQYAEEESGERLTSSQASRYWLFKGLKFIKDNPLDAFFLYTKKLALFWRKEEIPQNINYPLSKTFAPIFQLPFISFGIIAPFAILGIILSLKRRGTPLLVTLFIFSYMVSVIIFFVSARYRLLIVPFLIIFSSYALYCFVGMIRAKEFNNIIIFGIVLILFFVGINKNFKYFTIGPSSRHYSNLGRIYDRMGRLDEAIAEYKRSIAIDPNIAMAHSNLGAAYTSKNMFDDAISECRKAIAIKPNFAMAHYNLGIAYDKKGTLDAAIAEYERALAINPRYAEALNNLGDTYQKKGRLDTAIILYKKALSINPHFANTHFNLGNAYLKKGELDKAISKYKQAILIKLDYAKAHINLGLAYAKKGRLDEALSEYKKALTINPNHAKAHYNLGNAYLKKGDYRLAKTHYGKAMKLGYRVKPEVLELLKPYLPLK